MNTTATITTTTTATTSTTPATHTVTTTTTTTSTISASHCCDVDQVGWKGSSLVPCTKCHLRGRIFYAWYSSLHLLALRFPFFNCIRYAVWQAGHGLSNGKEACELRSQGS